MFSNEDYNKLYNQFSELAKKDASHNPVQPTLPSHVYADAMVPKVGNKLAYKEFLKHNADNGIHLSLDANGFDSINKQHGTETGDKAIKALFDTISEVSKKYGLKTFRTGGEEGRLHAPTPERAMDFVKELHQRLDSMPKVGEHKLSVSIGVGFNPDHAEKALSQAKDQLGSMVMGKRQKLNQPGNEKNVVQSLLHESPPVNWKPFHGQIQPIDEPKPVINNGLKLANPLLQGK